MVEATTNETKGADGVPVLLTVTQFCKRHPAFTAGGMRHLLFFDPEGMREACIVRFGRRVLIDEAAFFDWLRANRGRTNLFGGPPPKVTSKAKATPSPKNRRATRGDR